MKRVDLSSLLSSTQTNLKPNIFSIYESNHKPKANIPSQTTEAFRKSSQHTLNTQTSLKRRDATLGTDDEDMGGPSTITHSLAFNNLNVPKSKPKN